MPVVNPKKLDYQRDTLTASDFSAGINDDTSISAGDVGIIAKAEVGEDGGLASYEAIIMGQPPKNPDGDNKGNELFLKLQTAGADVADTVQIQFQARKKGELSGRAITDWIMHRNQDNSDPRQRKNLNVTGKGAVDAEEIIMVVRDETSSVTVDLSESSFEIPILGGK